MRRLCVTACHLKHSYAHRHDKTATLYMHTFSGRFVYCCKCGLSSRAAFKIRRACLVGRGLGPRFRITVWSRAAFELRTPWQTRARDSVQVPGVEEQWLLATLVREPVTPCTCPVSKDIGRTEQTQTSVQCNGVQDAVPQVYVRPHPYD